MMLGEKECSWDIAYFLENGKLPPVAERCAKGEVDIRTALEREWREPDMQYIMSRGCRFSAQLDWIQ